MSAILLFLAGMATPLAAGLTQSASKVDVTAQLQPNTGSDAVAIRVRLDIADGWHVNAHPASLDFLVPTAIEARAAGKTLPTNINWPAGHDSGIELAGTTIMVYSDDTEIPVRLAPATAAKARSAGQLTLRVRVQSCSDEGLCLPPSTIDVQLAQL